MPKRVTWSEYRESTGDRSGLFAALAQAWSIERAHSRDEILAEAVPL